MAVVYQPIWSTTWAEAQTPVVTVGGGTIPVGGRTVENGFHFSNALMRIGVSREVTLGPLTRTAAVQLGLAVRSVHYDLARSEEHTSELQSRLHLVCRLLLEKKKKSRASRASPHIGGCGDRRCRLR